MGSVKFPDRGGAVTVSATGALDGVGTVASPLAVKVDGVTVTIVGNELVAAGGTITVGDTQVLFGDGADNPAGDAGFTYDKTTDSATLVGGLTAASMTIASLVYPTADGNAGDVFTTDGAGNITLQPAANPFDQDLNMADAVVFASVGSPYVAASGTLTRTGSNPSNNDTVTLGSTIYTFKTVLTPADWEIEIGSNADESLRRLEGAVNNQGLEGTYQVPNFNPDVYTTGVSGSAMPIIARAGGTAGNSIATTTTTAWSFGAATLLGGVNGIPTANALFANAAFGIGTADRSASGESDEALVVFGVDSGRTAWAAEAADRTTLLAYVEPDGYTQIIANAPGGVAGRLQLVSSNGKVQVIASTDIELVATAAIKLTPTTDLTIDGTPGVTVSGFVKGIRTVGEVVGLTPVAFASLPAGTEGDIASVNDSNTATWGATIAAGGANKVLAYFNGTNWTVAGA